MRTVRWGRLAVFALVASLLAGLGMSLALLFNAASYGG